MVRPPAVFGAALTAALVVASLVTASSTARAQAVEEEPDEAAATERARSLFMEGLELADESDWERAVLRFRQALELRDAAPVRFNLATSLGQMGRRVEAIEELDRLLASNPDRELSESATNLRASLSSALGRLLVTVVGDAASLTVTVDGRPWTTIGQENVADPGVRVVRLLSGDEELDLEEAEVDVGRLTEVSLNVPVDAAPASDDGVLIGVLAGAGAALLIAGAIVLTVVLLESQPAGDFDPPVIVAD